MPNVQGPFGLRALRRMDGSAPNYATNAQQIAYNNSNKIARGDLVRLLASGFIDILAPGTTAPFGVFDGCEYYDPVQNKKTWSNAWLAPAGLPATTVVTCYIIGEDQHLVFEVQSGTVNPVGQGAVGNNIQIAQQAAPTAAGLSTLYVDQSLINTTATLPLRVWGLGQKIGNDNTTVFNTIEVVLNGPQLSAALGV